ncbi:unnamed protein product, partial [Didymodactylos carnosus]
MASPISNPSSSWSSPQTPTPPKRIRKKTSLVWNYFTEKNGGGVECVLCQRSMDNNSNSTTSMLFHLSVAHLP